MSAAASNRRRRPNAVLREQEVRVTPLELFFDLVFVLALTQCTALMAPPGVPDFLTRERFLPLGTCRVEGRAWSGWAPVETVEVSTDGGEIWHGAELEPEGPPSAWRGFSYVWEPAGPGAYELCCRTRDRAGNEQPADPPWNLKGYANNAIQRVPVTVEPEAAGSR